MTDTIRLLASYTARVVANEEPPGFFQWLRELGPYSSLFYGGVVALLFALISYLRAKHSTSVILLAVGASLVGLGVVLGIVRFESRWRVVLGFVPAFMVAAQGITMFRRAKWVVPSNLEKMRKHFEDQKLKFLVPFVDVIETSGGRLFDAPLLVTRLLIPALFIYSLCSLEAEYLSSATIEHLHTRGGAVDTVFPQAVIIAADYGLAGAYLFVVLHLGNRSYRSDITSGAAIWSMVTLATGPVVAGVLGMFMGDVATEDLTKTTGFGKAAAFFVAGFSPRFVVSYVDGAVRRSWLKQNGQREVVALSNAPLERLRGMTPEFIERLAEEGITTSTAMAMADPVRLIWNTGFDKRLLLRWMDQALLIEAWPDGVDALDKQGMLSAIAIAKLALDKHDTHINQLAKETKHDVETLRQVAIKLSQDHQVKLIWTLYELDDYGPDAGAKKEIAIVAKDGDSPTSADPSAGA